MKFWFAELIGALWLLSLSSVVTAETATLAASHIGVPPSVLSADPESDPQRLSEAAKKVAKELTTVVRLFERFAKYFFSKKSTETKSAVTPIQANAVTRLNEVENDQTTQHIFGLTVPIEFGSPAQRQNVMLSFSSSHLWLASQNVIFSRMIKNVFNQSNSETLEVSTDPFKLKFTEYSAYGFYATDTIKIGEFNAKPRFGIADSVSYVFPLLRVNGILGLAASDNSNALNDLLAGQDDPSFTLYHNPNANQLSNATNAVLTTFGGWDKSLCKDDWKSTKAQNNPFWKVTVSGAKIGRTNIREDSDGRAMITSTLPITIIPPATFAQIAYELGAVELKKEEGIFMVRCWSLPTIYFKIDGQEIPLNPDDYIIKVAGMCFLRLWAMSETLHTSIGMDYVFAQPLLRSNCIRFSPTTSEFAFASPKPQELQYRN